MYLYGDACFLFDVPKQLRYKKYKGSSAAQPKGAGLRMFKPFQYESPDQIKSDMANAGIDLPIADNLDILGQKIRLGNMIIKNSLGFHPMEGCDGNADGSPSELTVRRYKRFAGGGAGLLWFEAVAVVPEGRGNPRHLWINDGNIDQFKKLFQTMQKTAETSSEDMPVCIMQLTNAGRFSRPVDKPRPIIAYHNPYLNQRMKLPDDYPVITDDELERLEDAFVRAALLAREAGFHGIDVKSCHRYLSSELLSAYERKGKYGGDFEGRTRFIRNITGKIRDRLGKDFIIGARLNIYDGIPYPYGFGVDRDDYTKYDLSEPIRLIEMLMKAGLSILNVTMGTPYYNPHVNRPYDRGEYVPEESQFKGVERLLTGAGVIQKKFPDLIVVGTGFSWLRHLAPYFAAGVIEAGMASVAGFGRQSFAYPDFAHDILYQGGMKKEKCCIACGKCTELMRADSVTGCVVRDSEIYGKLYRERVIAKKEGGN